MSESIHLGYWGIRGRGQVLRLLLAFTGAEWTQKKYYTQQQWKGIGKDQTSLGLPFPNLPYLIHGDFKISESRAIMNYIINISNKRQLLGKDYKDEALVQNIVCVFNQFLGKLIELVLNVETFDTKLLQTQNFIESKLQIFEQHLKGRNFALGYLTLADFLITQVVYYFQQIYPAFLEKYSVLNNIKQSFQNLPQIKAYYAQQSSVKGPFVPPIGKLKF